MEINKLPDSDNVIIIMNQFEFGLMVRSFGASSGRDIFERSNCYPKTLNKTFDSKPEHDWREEHYDIFDKAANAYTKFFEK